MPIDPAIINNGITLIGPSSGLGANKVLEFDANGQGTLIATPSGGGGGGGLTPIAKSTTYTAVNGDFVVADTSAASWTLTLPTPTSGHRVGVILAVSGVASGYALTISGTIVGGTSDNKLYVVGDEMEFLADGTSWHVGPRRIMPHLSHIRHDTLDSVFTPNIVTVVDMETVVHDECYLSSLAANTITIKRAGKYAIHGQVTSKSIASGQYLNGYVYLDGNPLAGTFRAVSSGITSVEMVKTIDLAIGAVLDLRYLTSYNNTANKMYGGASAYAAPWLSVEEVGV